MLILWFYLSYWLTLILTYNALSIQNYLQCCFVAVLIGVANTCAGMGEKTVREWFEENPLRFLRYFMIPFGVSSISMTAGLSGEEEFFLIFSTDGGKLGTELGVATGSVAVLAVARWAFTDKEGDKGFEERYDGVRKEDERL